jgi:hypothetical protein
MTWELRSAVAMGMAPIALAVVVVTSICGGAAQVLAIELGELQAVPSNFPPYIFRLPLITPLHGPSAMAAVTVRQPPDARSFVKQHVVELRLRSLTDVELEVSYGEQTLNRLLLKSELQAARMRLEMAPVSNPSPPARAKDRDRPFPEASSMAQAPEGVSDRPLFEREFEGIRQEIQRLVERVTPWKELSSPLGDGGESAITAVLTLMLGGCFSVGVTLLIMGYLMQRRASDRERRRRRALTLSIRRMRDQLAARVPILPALPPVPLSRAGNQALEPVTISRRIRVSQKRRRRFRVWVSSHMRDVAQEHDAERIRLVARTSQRVPSAPAELLEALVQLRGELMRLQGRPPTSATPNATPNILEARSRRASR